MKISPWILLFAVSWGGLSALAQTNAASSPAPAPAPGAGPGAMPVSGSVTDEQVFDPPARAIAKAALNIRGRPAFKGEVIGHFPKGAEASVLELFTLRKPAKDEPARWARVALPTNTAVWVFADYIDPNTKTVTARRVNVRGGPGENYSVVGHLLKGTTVSEVRRKNRWIQIETPADAFGFVAADYLELEAAAVAPAVAQITPAPAAQPPAQPAPAAQPPAQPAPAPSPPAQPAPALTPPTQPPPAAVATPPPTTPPTETPAAPAENPPKPAEPAPIVAPEPTATPPAETPPPAGMLLYTPERVILREGILRRVYNILAPADYELQIPASGEIVDYIQPKEKENLKRYIGKRVLVTGTEVLDQRWPRTPVLQVQKLELAP